MRRLLTLTLAAASLAAGQHYYPDDPLAKMPDPLYVDDVAFRKLNDYYDLFTHQLGSPGERHPENGPPIRAQSANTVDEVPDDPAWFINRIGSREYSIDELRQGAGSGRPPKPGVWTITAAKTEGVTPGFRIEDSTGERYLLKFDPLKHPEMATGADVVGSLAFHALGFNVPENYLVEFDPDDLAISPDAKIPDIKGVDRPITRFDVDHALLRVPTTESGTIRAIASRFLKGKIIGEFRFYGTRSDDPNDIVPHEHRRELRGLHVFDAWLNHNDSRAINDLDSLVEEGDLKYVKHFLIDFGAILGSASVVSNTARDGNAYFYNGRSALTQALTLGLYVPKWARPDYHRSPAIGMINWTAFHPDRWKPNYPNPAFDNRLPDDEFWAAKKIMAFTDEHIRALVGAADYSDPEDTAKLVEYLIKRRDKIGEVYFAKVLPLDRFRVEGDQLAFDDLAQRHGLPSPERLEITWGMFDNQTGQTEWASAPTGTKLPTLVVDSGKPVYYAARIVGADPKKTVVVHVRVDGGRAEVVGVRRHWQGSQPES